MSQSQKRTRIFENPNQVPNSQSDRQSDIQPLRTSHIEPMPNKQKHILYFSNLNTPRVFCHYHPDQIIQNFCKNQECLMPLCPACVKIHSEEHNTDITTAQFDLLETCLLEQYNKIVDICNEQTEDIQKIHDFKNEIRNHRDNQKIKFQEAKEQFLKLIDQHFQKLEQELNKHSITNTDQLLQETNTQHKLLYEQWESFQRKLQKLNSERCLKTLIKSYKINRPEVKFQASHQAVINFLNRKRTEMPSLQINNHYLKDVINSVQLYITTTNRVQEAESLQIVNQQQQSIQQQPIQQQQQFIQQPIQQQQYTQQQTQPQPQYNQQQILSQNQTPARVLQGFPMYTNNQMQQIQNLQSRVLPSPPIIPAFQCQPQQMIMTLPQAPQAIIQPNLTFQPQANLTFQPQMVVSQCPPAPIPIAEVIPISQPGMVINLQQQQPKGMGMAQKYHEYYNTIVQNPNQPLTRSKNYEDSDKKYEFSPRIEIN